jgi:hypothetical protein
MKSIGADRRVHISSYVYDRVKHNPAFQFIPRGETFCKGIGNVQTYFVERAMADIGK